MRHSFVILFACALLLSACREPRLFESFVQVSEAESGVFSFDADLSDSLCSYDVSLYTRVDRRSGSSYTDRMKVKISWESPSGKVYDESVWMKTGDHRGVRQLYRRGIVPSEFGLWTISIEPGYAPEGFRGLGVIIEKNGTR